MSTVLPGVRLSYFILVKTKQRLGGVVVLGVDREEG